MFVVCPVCLLAYTIIHSQIFMGEVETTNGTGIMSSTTTVTVHLNPSQGPECKLVCTGYIHSLTLFFHNTNTWHCIFSSCCFLVPPGAWDAAEQLRSSDGMHSVHPGTSVRDGRSVGLLHWHVWLGIQRIQVYVIMRCILTCSEKVQCA